VLPSLPGFGFSAEPAEVGWDPSRIARAWAELMRRLGYTRYVAQGGDLGAYVCDEMGRQAPAGLLGVHLNLLKTTLVGPAPAEPSAAERTALAAIAVMQTSGYGYFLEQATRPQTIGYALLDSPVALAAWMIDHDTDSYYKISRAFLDGQPSGHLTRDQILDNITLYWLTGTGASAAREYWENGPVQSGNQHPAVPQPAHRRMAPAQGIHQTRHQLPQATPRDPARRPTARPADLGQSASAAECHIQTVTPLFVQNS
jgi:pimeloyl-ACP methyl ester carboxylesterase